MQYDLEALLSRVVDDRGYVAIEPWSNLTGHLSAARCLMACIGLALAR